MTDPDIRALVTMGDLIAAVRLYQERHGGSVLAARKAVDAMRWDQTQTQGRSLSVDESELDELLRQGGKIAAIKRYRELHGVGLKEAKDAIDARAAGLATPTPAHAQPAHAPPTHDPEVLAFLRGGSKIQAIKRYRELHGIGLKEAKDAVEAIVLPPDATETDALQPELDRLIAQDRKIDAIKHYRQITSAGLKESKDFVEARMAELAAASASPAGLQPELDRLLHANQKIYAIKHYRTVTGVGLKEAKDAVEARMAELGR